MKDGLLRRENIHEDESLAMGGEEAFQPVTFADEVLRFSKGGHHEVQDRACTGTSLPEVDDVEVGDLQCSA